VRAYLEDRTTYLEAANEAVNDAAAVFQVVERVLENLPVAWMKLTTMLIGRGDTVAKVVQTRRCPNSSRCKKKGKKMGLDWAASLLLVIPDLFETCNRQGIPLFGSARGCELLRTHRAECGLF
jgi:hypothetical protein